MSDVVKQQNDSENVEGKVFVGGLSWQTTEDGLKYYFEKFGELTDVAIMTDKRTGQPRGFGFVVLKDAAAVDIVLGQTHNIDGRVVDVKRAVPRDKAPAPSRQESRKIFVGGLAPEVGEKEFNEYFSKFGPLQDSIVMYDRKTNRSRGFGFVTFQDEETIQSVLRQDHEIMGKWVEIKRAEPREPSKPMGVMGGRMDGRGGMDMRGRGGRGGYDDYAYGAGGAAYSMHPAMHGQAMGRGGAGYGYPSVRYGENAGEYGAAGAVGRGYAGGYGYSSGPYYQGAAPYTGYGTAAPQGNGMYAANQRTQGTEDIDAASYGNGAMARNPSQGDQYGASANRTAPMVSGAAIQGYGGQMRGAMGPAGMSGMSMYPYGGAAMAGYGASYGMGGSSNMYQAAGAGQMAAKPDAGAGFAEAKSNGNYTSGYRSGQPAVQGRMDRGYQPY